METDEAGTPHAFVLPGEVLEVIIRRRVGLEVVIDCGISGSLEANVPFFED